MGSHFDYQTLLAVRAALGCRIADDAAQKPGYDDSAFNREPDRLMRVYGLLAKLDAEIVAAEDQALRSWVDSRSGVR